MAAQARLNSRYFLIRDIFAEEIQYLLTESRLPDVMKHVLSFQNKRIQIFDLYLQISFAQHIVSCLIVN